MDGRRHETSPDSILEERQSYEARRIKQQTHDQSIGLAQLGDDERAHRHADGAHQSVEAPYDSCATVTRTRNTFSMALTSTTGYSLDLMQNLFELK